MSDHRPVMSVFQAQVELIDHARKIAIAKEIKAGLVARSVEQGELVTGMMTDLGLKNGRE